MKSICFILILVIISCASKEQDGFKLEKLNVDSTIAYYNLVLEEKVKLIENENVILTDVNDVSMNFNNEEIIICDNALKKIIYFNYKNGEIINTYETGLYIQSNFVNSFTKEINSWNEEPLVLLDTNQYENFGLTKEFVDNTVISRFTKVLYEDSLKVEVITYGIFPAAYKNKTGNHILNLPLITKINKLSKEISINTLYDFDNKDFFPFTYDGIKIDDKYYIPTYNQTFLVNYLSKGNILDEDYELATISMHNEYGEYQNIFSYLPEFYKKSKIYHNFLQVSMINYNNNVLYSYYLDNNIYFNDRVLFKLINLPYDNSKGYFELGKRINIKNNKNKLKQLDYKKYCPISLIKLFSRKNNILILVNVVDVYNNNHEYFILQEYSKDGNLITQTYFKNSNSEIIKKIFYDSKNDYLCFLRKSKEGWSIEKRSFK